VDVRDLDCCLLVGDQEPELALGLGQEQELEFLVSVSERDQEPEPEFLGLEWGFLELELDFLE
tara:strand:- start:23 stop:211 length:189 start_codon:yes stop_codon:yes gene_type:complete